MNDEERTRVMRHYVRNARTQNYYAKFNPVLMHRQLRNEKQFREGISCNESSLFSFFAMRLRGFSIRDLSANFEEKKF